MGQIRKYDIYRLVVLLAFCLLNLAGCGAPRTVDHEHEALGTSFVGFTPSEHFKERLVERKVTVEQVRDVLENGDRFYDPKNDSHIRWKNGIYVALTDTHVIKTVIRGRVEDRWRRE